LPLELFSQAMILMTSSKYLLNSPSAVTTHKEKFKPPKCPVLFNRS